MRSRSKNEKIDWPSGNQSGGRQAAVPFRNSLLFYPALFASLFCLVMQTAYAAASPPTAPGHLEVDGLSQPLGIDSARPIFSWQLMDSRFGARQTAYRVMVASKPALLRSNRPDIWDSGRALSEESAGAEYSGPALRPSTRYYWRVQAWDKDGRAYPPSETSWWETGLISQSPWKEATWIGHEEPELRAVRESRAAWIMTQPSADLAGEKDMKNAYRFRFAVTAPVKRAELFVSAEDTADAWINGTQVMSAQPLTAWGQMPWATYRRQDVTAKLHPGSNVLAIQTVRYEQTGKPVNVALNACLYVEMADGSTAVFKTGNGWKSAFEATAVWTHPAFDDSGWNEAVPFLPPADETAVRPWPTGPVAELRHRFIISKPVASARLYVTALGAYEVHLNGKKIGDEILAPGWTDYRERVNYQTFDVTGNLKRGPDVIAGLLAPGWYTTPLMWERRGNNYGDTPPAFKALLRITHTDGSIEWIKTDQTWRASVSPILSAEIYDGETIDSRQAQAGWDTSTFHDDQWSSIEIVQPQEPEIVAQNFQPIRVEKLLASKAVTSPKPGVYIYDFGQNLAGVARLRIQGTRGTDLQLRFAEVLNPDGTIYTANLRSAKATDHFILAGHGVEEFQPGFTFHGFRYVELTGLPAPPPAGALEAVAFHTDAPFTVQLRTGSAMVNQLWSNILWGQRSNFLSVPTDCPQRDERLGWSGDAQVFWRTATYNMDLLAFSRKYAQDLRGTQRGNVMYGIFAPGTYSPNPGFATGWSDAGIIIPWTAWLQYGDVRIIQQNWDGMQQYIAKIAELNPDYLWKNQSGNTFGDWLAPEGPTAQDLIATAYWAYDASLMEEMAHAIGRSADEKKYHEIGEQIKNAFQRAYISPQGFIRAALKPDGPPVETQTGYVLALHMKLVPADLRAAASRRLVTLVARNHWKIGTGFLGTPYLLSVLSDSGYSDLSYRLLLNTGYPSWGYMVEHGATTMWERWNGDQMRGDPTMNSYNHYAYGAVADWIYRYASGISATPDDPGFHTIELHPNFDQRLGSVDLSFESRYGTVKSSWTLANHQAIWNLTIPPNSSGRLPLSTTQVGAFTLDGSALAQNSKIKNASTTAAGTIYELPAGSYSFHVTVP